MAGTCQNQVCGKMLAGDRNSCQDLCGACYQRWRRAGYPDSGVPGRMPRRHRPGCRCAFHSSRKTHPRTDQRIRMYGELRYARGMRPAQIAAEMGMAVSSLKRYRASWNRREDSRRALLAGLAWAMREVLPASYSDPVIGALPGTYPGH